MGFIIIASDKIDLDVVGCHVQAVGERQSESHR